ncbi:protein-glutamate methylesterase/protein-glutamine glutaminase [Succinimonas amylolytica]|uniref:protein-glutamate methylesterase/protein-glutamine glutaminase n=1 Tax=Succinimonas amylolytica TaxID=83769 RepID=UPI00037F3429|nr:chemotaxis response regulator protein-glutamate methylesterase [Succinimonas amylolytica]
MSAVKVLIVDDSTFYRKRLKEMFDTDPEIDVVGEAANGKIAVEMTRTLKPDVITMDVEMPVMGGIEAVKKIMEICPTPVLMFSSLTEEGARETLEALSSGASDYLPKDFAGIARRKTQVVQDLCAKVKALGSSIMYRSRRLAAESSDQGAVAVSRTQTNESSSRRLRGSTPGFMTPAELKSRPAESRWDNSRQTQKAIQAMSNVEARLEALINRKKAELNALTNLKKSQEIRNEVLQHHKSSVPEGSTDYQILAIGSSTGGPNALQVIISELPETIPFPIVVAQHMTALFTKSFAERLNKLSRLNVKEAEDGEQLKPGWVYIAPGGRQITVTSRYPRNFRISVIDSPPEVYYRPSVDILMGSLSRCAGLKVLAIILTGMGQDGKMGCKLLHDKGSEIWAQDEMTSVIYGMPKAVAGFASRILPLQDIAGEIVGTIVK